MPKKRSQPESLRRSEPSPTESPLARQGRIFAVGLIGLKRLIYLAADYYHDIPNRYGKLVFTDIQQYRQLLRLLRARRKSLNRLGIHFGGYQFATDTKAVWIIWFQLEGDKPIDSEIIRFHLAPAA